MNSLYVFFIVLAISICTVNQNASAQTKGEKINSLPAISGTVTDKSGNPIAFADVFISGTTIGTATNKYGNFVIKPPFFPCTLIADHVSFNPFVKNLKGDENEISIKLNDANIELSEIEIKGTSNRKKNLTFFYSRFIRNKKNKVEILNDSVLRFKVSNNEFLAYTHEPLIIINKILGYKIKIRIQGFKVYRALSPGGRRLPLNDLMGMEYAQLSGYFFYEPLETDSEKELENYKNNRLRYYFGSDRHFFKSLFDNTLDKNGFEIKPFANQDPSTVISEVKNYSSGLGGKNYSLVADSIKVIYRFGGQHRFPKSHYSENKLKRIYAEESRIYGSPTIFTIWENGTSPDLNLTVVGPLAPGTNFVNSLPKDFSPNQ